MDKVLTFPSRNRAAFHVRMLSTASPSVPMGKIQCFHLALERLFMSGQRSLGCITPGEPQFVSISLSSGFSFQAEYTVWYKNKGGLFQSRYRAASHFRVTSITQIRSHRNLVSISLSSGFSFQDHRHYHLCQSHHVSISLSSGFSFQGSFLFVGLSPARRFNLVIERLLISGTHCESGRIPSGDGFNLVIERLLISGAHPSTTRGSPHSSFNLVIERLLISGSKSKPLSYTVIISFNLVIERLLISGNALIFRKCFGAKLFQSRYRAASHFRYPDTLNCPTPRIPVSISLSSGFSFQADF